MFSHNASLEYQAKPKDISTFKVSVSILILCLNDLPIDSSGVEYTFFSSVYRIFFKTHQMLGHKVSLGKFKKTEIIPCLFSDHNILRLKINYRKIKTYKTQNVLAKQHATKLSMDH